ncbi:MAG: PEP-CTERM sorting domain-containing protein [Verrucomicrobiaceae bacterium]|nr:MAG: PEP-CTERM sorting domain-containing protein [Verrucomicrobiaceae bacterium]
MKLNWIFALAVFSFTSYQANAFVIALPGTEGLPVFANGGNVTATYEGNSAGYDNFLYLERSADLKPGLDGDQSNDLFVFFNHGNNEGDTLELGNFPSGTELVFRLYVSNTGDNFYSGEASRNADGFAHARVDNSWKPNTTLVSFEDLYNLPEGVNGFNDLSFSFTNTRSTPTPVPDFGSTLSLLGLVLPAMAVGRHFRRQTTIVSN